MATIVAIWPNWGFCRIGKFNSCTFTTPILKNLHHWFVFIFDVRTCQVFSGPCISQCIVFNWKALICLYISSFQLSWVWKSGYNGLTIMHTVNLITITSLLVHVRIQYFSAGKIERARIVYIYPEVLYDILPSKTLFAWNIQWPVFLANSIATV